MNRGSLKYTVYGDVAFDRKIDKDMKVISEKILTVIPESDVDAIILGGGYGRGEGGVSVGKDGSMELYNDYDMFLISNGLSYSKRKKYRKEVHKASQELTHRIGVDVDFSPMVNREELSHMPFTLMYYELKEGHNVIYGDRNILESLPIYDIDKIPKEEHLNLMLNRGTGLILAGIKLTANEKTKEDNMFIERNIFKALMACGDVFLMSMKDYNYSYVKRFDLIEKFRDHPLLKEDNFIEYYKMSLMYKLKPDNNFNLNKERYEYALKIYRRMYLYIFGIYWNCKINDFQNYYAKLAEKGIGNKKSLSLFAKNILLNAKEIGFKNFEMKFFTSYPRLRLFYSLPFFLFSENALNKNDVCRVLGVSEDLLGTDLKKRYIKIWNRFN